jgi:nucleotide-binding universal stress UspA family protein
MYRKIVVAVDGSPSSKLALLEAIKIARSMAATLRLVHVVDEFVPEAAVAGLYYSALVEALKAVGAKTMEDAEAIVHQHGLESERVLVETLGHRVASTIVDQARLWGADLIVAGTHGRRGLSRLVMGSDAELILRTSPVPVLLVREISASAAAQQAA